MLTSLALTSSGLLVASSVSADEVPGFLRSMLLQDVHAAKFLINEHFEFYLVLP